PTVDPVDSPTSIRSQTLTGTKEAGTDVRINGVSAVPVNPSAAWAVDVFLQSGTNTFSLRSADAFGFISEPVEVQIVFLDLPPGPVVPLLDGVGNGITASVIWTNYNEVSNGADIAYYEIYQSSNAFTNINEAMLIGSNAAGSRTFTATGLVRNTMFHFGVRAVDVASNTVAAIVSTNVMTDDVVPPANPSGLFFDVFQTQLVLHWSPPPDVDGDLFGYHVYFETNAPVFVPAGIHQFSQTGLVLGTAYDFILASLDNETNESAGVGSTGITALENPTQIVADAFSFRVDLAWNGITPGNFVQHYAIYRDTAPYTNVMGMTPVLTTTSTNRSVAGLDNGTTYYFAVVA
ncbi:MAG: hypothetical protein AAF492_32560, partial [Verrucomicrobiota bacterium]